MMEEKRARRVNDAKPAGSQPEAQIDILVGGEEMRIEAADFFEERFANHEAGTGDCGYFPGADKTARITIHIDGKLAHGMIGGAAHAERDPGVLDRMVLVSEKRSRRAGIGL